MCPAMVDDMVYKGDVPWHGIGTPIQPNTTAHEALILCKMDWIVNKSSLFVPALSDAGGFVDVPGFVALQRSDNGNILGVTTDRYVPLQNTDLANVVEGFLNTGNAQIESAGSLKSGKIVWYLLDLDSAQEVTSEDGVKLYAVLSNGHDGKRAVRVGYTPIRIVCSNTLAMSESSHLTRTIRVTHRGDVVGGMKAIVDSMDLANQTFKATVEQYRKLTATNINQNDVRKYVEKVLGLDAEQSTRAKNIISLVEYKALHGIGNEQHAGTAWAAYNAITEYLSHDAGRNPDSRYSNLWFGIAANTNKRALDLALEMVA